MTPVSASARLSVSDQARTYVKARAAAMSGDHGQAAQLLASLASSQPGQLDLGKKALAEAIGAGQIDLALDLARKLPPSQLSTDSRLLLMADEIRRNRPDRAMAWLSVKGESGDLSFLAPLVSAWTTMDRGGVDQALANLDQIPSTSVLAPLVPEQRAFMLIRARRTAEAEPLARRAVGSAGGREERLRTAFSDAFLAAGDRPRALMIIEGMGQGEPAQRQRVQSGKRTGQAVDNLSRAFAEVLTAFAADIARMQRAAPPIGLVQVAHYANPQSSSTTSLLALLLAGQERTTEALALLRSVPSNDPLISQIRDDQSRILGDDKRWNEAYQLATSAAASPSADASDYSRLGDVLQSMKRHAEAANAYGRAVQVARAQNLKTELWSLLLLQASSLEDAGRWPEAKMALQQALALQPEQPLLLNFMGYGQLERGENMDSAEAMIRKANQLAPDDASITDSLGWAEFKRGKVDDAIATLQKAAEKDASQAEIQEHLGDALYKSGRRYEARFAWNAALVTAQDEIATRVKAKLSSGLTPGNAAP